LVWLLLLAAADAGAQTLPGGIPQPPIRGVQLSPPPAPPQRIYGHHGFFRGFPVFYVEREYVPVVEREVIREVPAAQPAPPPAPPRKPYVIGRSYAALPGSCMKMVEGSGIYFLCGGEWYRQVGAGQYKAVSAPL